MIKMQPQKGFVILFAVLISVIILLIGFGMYNIAIKESLLSSIASEAQYSFMAADGGAECVLFAVSHVQSGQQVYDTPFDCNGITRQFALVSSGTYVVEIPLPGDTCATVTYTEAANDRTIYSQGFNRCSGAEHEKPQRGNPRLVERVLELTYSVGGGSNTPPVNPPPPLLGSPKVLPPGEIDALKIPTGTLQSTSPNGQ